MHYIRSFAADARQSAYFESGVWYPRGWKGKEVRRYFGRRGSWDCREGSTGRATAEDRMALPEANEKISHGEPTWFAGKGKVFAMLDDHHHGATHLAVWLPQPFDAQEALIGSDPARFFRPPYVGVSGWVGVVLDTGPDLGCGRRARA